MTDTTASTGIRHSELRSYLNEELLSGGLCECDLVEVLVFAITLHTQAEDQPSRQIAANSPLNLPNWTVCKHQDVEIRLKSERSHGVQAFDHSPI